MFKWVDILTRNAIYRRAFIEQNNQRFAYIHQVYDEDLGKGRNILLKCGNYL